MAIDRPSWTEATHRHEHHGTHRHEHQEREHHRHVEHVHHRPPAQAWGGTGDGSGPGSIGGMGGSGAGGLGGGRGIGGSTGGNGSGQRRITYRPPGHVCWQFLPDDGRRRAGHRESDQHDECGEAGEDRLHITRPLDDQGCTPALPRAATGYLAAGRSFRGTAPCTASWHAGPSGRSFVRLACPPTSSPDSCETRGRGG